MRTVAIVLTATILLLAMGAAWGAFGDILGSFPAPDQLPIALAWENAHLWVYCIDPPCLVYRVNPNNGSVYTSFSPPTARGRGLTWNGTYLWYGVYSPNVIWRLSTGGSIRGSFTIPAYYGGLSWDGTYLWATSRIPGTFWRVTTTSSVVSSFTTFFEPRDPGFDGRYLIDATNSPLNMIYRLTTVGSVVQLVPPPADYPWGCCVGGGYLWISTAQGTNRIWRLDLGPVDVVPASLGRVKGLFR